MIILVLEHHPLTSEAVTMLIHRLCPEAKVVTATSLKMLSALIDKYNNAQVVVMEPQSHGAMGPGSVSYVVSRLPDAKILVLTDADLDENNNVYLDKGASCFVDKKSKLSKITSALQKLLLPNAKDTESSTDHVQILKLSKRHRQLIGMLEQGLNNEEIAQRLGISENTVKVHFFRLYKIIGVNSRMQALHYAKSHGWLGG